MEVNFIENWTSDVKFQIGLGENLGTVLTGILFIYYTYFDFSVGI